MRNVFALAVVLLVPLLACKTAKKQPAPQVTAAPAPSPTVKARYRPSPSQLVAVCGGKGIDQLEATPPAQARGALVVRKTPDGELEHVEYASLSPHQNGYAVSMEDVSVVACVEVKKKKKLDSCRMDALDVTKMGGTLNLYSWEYDVTLRDAKTAKVISEKKVKRADKKCPPIHSFKGSEEDLEPPFAVSGSVAIGDYQDTK